ncbi:Hypothetical protein A7982_02250 [Minicystis rosea]|nr:Hypothetical protein A7982_02250 [Minicystis rosea]
MTDGFTEFQLGARTAPLGLAFWDPRAARLVGDGLRIVARPVLDPSRSATAMVSPSRTWVFHKLPGMGLGVERGEGDASFWTAPPKTRSYVIEVDDDLGRFLPFQFAVDAPVRDPLVFPLPAGFTVTGMPPGAIPLFSTSNRPVTPGLAAIRADLWDPSATAPPGFKGPGGPASWAMMTATVGGSTTVRALADARGSVALVLPYPAPVGAGPDGLHSVPLTAQTWSVDLTVHYAPAAGERPARAALPDVLKQAAGSLWEKWDDADATKRVKLATGSLTLAYGEDLVVRTAGARPSVLYVTKP